MSVRRNISGRSEQCVIVDRKIGWRRQLELSFKPHLSFVIEGRHRPPFGLQLREFENLVVEIRAHWDENGPSMARDDLDASLLAVADVVTA
jgi:hypothetical protein